VVNKKLSRKEQGFRALYKNFEEKRRERSTSDVNLIRRGKEMEERRKKENNRRMSPLVHLYQRSGLGDQFRYIPESEDKLGEKYIGTKRRRTRGGSRIAYRGHLRQKVNGRWREEPVCLLPLRSCAGDGPGRIEAKASRHFQLQQRPNRIKKSEVGKMVRRVRGRGRPKLREVKEAVHGLCWVIMPVPPN